MTTTEVPALDEAKLAAFVGEVVTDMGAAISDLLVHIGDRLGLYSAMAGAGPITSAERTYESPPEQAMVLANEDSPAVFAGAFETIASCYAAYLVDGWLPALDGVIDKLRAGASVADVGCGMGAARSARHALAADGTLLLVEPNAGDALEHNLNPVGRTYYGLSTVVCTPGSLAQEVGMALGAQAGELQLAAVLREAGFSHVRRATETPFNIVLEAKP